MRPVEEEWERVRSWDKGEEREKLGGKGDKVIKYIKLKGKGQKIDYFNSSWRRYSKINNKKYQWNLPQR